MFYSIQLDQHNFVFAIGRHETNNPPVQDMTPGAPQVLFPSKMYPVQVGMKFSPADGGFYKLDEYGNNISESFVEYNE